ncbi:MAG: tetratricopeptide repeat protein, partial [Burkholderiales bacterium]
MTIAWAEEPDLDEIVRNPVIGNYKGYAEFKMGHYETARVIWEALAKRGNGEANFNLGTLYEDGLGVPQSIETALAHYERGAEAGSGKAQYRLGLLYSVGAKIPKDEAKAPTNGCVLRPQGATGTRKSVLRWPEPHRKRSAIGIFSRPKRCTHPANIRKRRRSGNASRSSAIRVHARVWRGWPRPVRACRAISTGRLFRQSAEEGDADAQYALAVMLQTGKGQALN